jgi:hypothetical protein
MTTRHRILSFGAVAVIAVGPGAALASAPGHRFARCHSGGDYATCVASGNVGHPQAIYVQVKSHPHQHITGSWSMTCSRGSAVGSKSGHFRGTTPVLKGLKKPFSDTSSCSVAAQAQLKNHGRLKVALEATH